MVVAVEGYEFGLLGPLRGRHDGRDLDPGSPLHRAVLVRLLLAEGRQCGLAHLIDALWEEPPTNAVRSLQTYVYRIRLALGEERSRLETSSGGYRLDIPEQAVDALRFEQLVRDGEELVAARRTGPALRAFDAAPALWSGEPLSGVPGPYAQRQRRRFLELRLNARVARLGCADELGEHARVATELVALIADHPLRRTCTRSACARCTGPDGRRRPLAVYAAARQTMVAELGMEPGPELRELQTRVLSGAEPEPVETRPEGPRAAETAPSIGAAGSDAAGTATHVTTSTVVTTSAGASGDTAARSDGDQGQHIESAADHLADPSADRSARTQVDEVPTGVRPQQLPRRPATS